MSSENISIRLFKPIEGQEKFIEGKEFYFDFSKDFGPLGNREFAEGVLNYLSTLDESLYIEAKEDESEENKLSFRHGLNFAICLIGEYGYRGYSLRTAQSILRFDKQPSYWSHSFLIRDFGYSDLVNTLIWESTLNSSGVMPQLNMLNAVSIRKFSDYYKTHYEFTHSHVVPNIAITIFALSKKEAELIKERAKVPMGDQIRYDFPKLAATWNSHIFDRSNSGNPIVSGNAMPGSAYVQYAYDAIGLDLSAGMHTRNINPENIWQSVKIFYPEYAVKGRPVLTFYCIRDPYCEVIPFEYLSNSDNAKVMLNLENAMEFLRESNTR